jgi:hydroxymethylpyrimidine/phosphomethylpyrimidine kinase
MKSILTLAGSDPSGGAGVQIDIRVFYRLGLHPFSVITAITVQNTLSVFKVIPVDDIYIKEQIEAILKDTDIEVVKTGMIYTESAVKTIAETLDRRDITLVIDPVTVSSTGTPLQEEGVLQSIVEYLLPMAAFVTPNINEASLISGIEILNRDDMIRAAEKIYSFGVKNVVIKGGHMEGEESEDLFFDGVNIKWLSSERVKGRYHGTGCVFSSALASYLALGNPADKATALAKGFVLEAIKRAYSPGRGMAILGV